MSHDFYSEINFHVVWHTKNNAPMLSGDIEIACHKFLRQRLVATREVFVHEVGGIEDHVHVALTMPPTILPCDFIGQLKGACSFEINRRWGTGRKVLEWQKGYGIVSFGTKDMPWVVNYIRNQREHHARETMVDRLERISKPEH